MFGYKNLEKSIKILDKYIWLNKNLEKSIKILDKYIWLDKLIWEGVV
uniref:Uncharacterized protein n=1 Tax=viral metagenome TaxID=1070528 RepID=A0A6C0AF00_9ZZZZ